MKRIFGLALVLALTLGLAPSAFAQVSGGNIYGIAEDPSGAVLPGVTVKLTSAYGTREATTGSQGDFRFINIERGSYKLTLSLAGFSTVTRDVLVSLGSNVNVTFSLKVATLEETVNVTAETPIVDTKRVGTGTTLTKEELADIPSARDPWAMLRAVPGVVMDRVNVGGNENGQQANFVGKGDNGNNVMWNLDGVVVTDTGSLSSPSYYDFDAFEEVSVNTGGNDVRAQTGGVGINLTTRRGQNAFHGSTHGYLTSHKLESTNLPSQLLNDPRLANADGSFRDSGDHIRQLADYGLELGGPILKDKLWFYGSWGRQDIRVQRINGTADKTILTSYNAKLNWQASANDQVSLFFFNGEKVKLGRGVGFAPNEQPSFLWNQGGLSDRKPAGFTKLQWDRTFSQSFFLSFKLSDYQTGFFLHPAGGTQMNGGVDFEAGIARGTYVSVDNTRPAKTANLDASYFASAMGGSHEFKFGFGYRRFNVTTTTHWGGDGLFGYKFGGGADYVHVNRDARNATQADYLSGYLGDTFTKDRLTVNLGLRYDRQTAKNLPSSVPASALIPDILGAVSWDGVTVAGRSDNPAPTIKFSDISPRAAVTIALDEGRKTVLRTSYARYASQLPSAQASFFSPFTSPGSYFAYYWSDVNGDGLPSPNEVRTDLGPLYYNYVDPNDPNGPSKNKLGDYHAQHDNEFILGIERELIPDLAVSMAYTYRTGTGHSFTPRAKADGSLFTAADYSVSPTSRNGFTATRYRPNHALVLDSGNSRMLLSRPDYSRKYNGFEATIAKRLSHRWMGRVAFTYNSPTESLSGPGALGNPSRTDTSGALTSGPQDDGGLYSPRSGGSGKGDTIIGAKWQIVANALVQLPFGFDVAAAFFGRQGHPYAIIASTGLGDDGSNRVLADNVKVDSSRLPTVYNLDLRLAKNFKFGKSTLTIAGDVFNVMNANTTLGIGRRFSSSQWSESNLGGAFGRTDEILNPRVARFSLRYAF